MIILQNLHCNTMHYMLHYIVLQCKFFLQGGTNLDKEIMKGYVEILILLFISKKDTYGYEIVKDLNKMSDNLYSMKEGTLYPALKRLEIKEFIKSYWGNFDEFGRRKYYCITNLGHKELNEKLNELEKLYTLVKSCKEGYHEGI